MGAVDAHTDAHRGAAATGYRHAALMYAGRQEFVRRTTSFIRSGVALDEPTLVVVADEKIDLLRRELRGDAAKVAFADMHNVGANPALIIPAWQEFIAAHPGRRLRGIGEPIDPERGAAELVECQHHERLLNLAFADSKLFLVCPYDTSALAPEVIAEARRSHPLIGDHQPQHCNGYVGDENACALLAEPLPEPGVTSVCVRFELDDLAAVRDLVARVCDGAGLAPPRSQDLGFAVNELMTNSVSHGGGEGTLRVWREPGELICEVRDRGTIDDPMAGRRRPSAESGGGYGLWLANQLCDLVQLRTGPAGSTVRVHVRTG